MGMTPINDLRPLTSAEPASSGLELHAVGRVENSSRAGEDPSRRRQPAARQDSDYAEIAGETVTESTAASAEPAIPHKISFFA